MKIRGIRISYKYSGLCNQMIQFIHGVIQSICDGVDVVVVDNFRTNIHSDATCPIEDIIDISGFREYVRMNYGVVVVGKNEFGMAIKKVEYGTMTSYLDITEKFTEEFLRENNLQVPRHAPLNTLCGDPAINKRKSIRIAYSITKDAEIVKYYTEESREISCHFEQIQYEQFPHWPKQIVWMETLINHLLFRPDFYMTDFKTDHKVVHVVHARLEYDATRHWARENKMDKTEFHNLLAKKYIDCITNHMNDGIILLLSYHSDNRVAELLKEQGRPYIFIEKDPTKGREWNAAQDMSVAERHGNGAFIGNFDIYRMQGSTFSYFLMKKCRFHKHILIDIERIHEEPLVLPCA